MTTEPIIAGSPRERPWPSHDANLAGSVVEFLQFVHTTCVNKLAGLDEAVDWDSFIEVYDRPVRVARLLVDVLQESARHLGHLDVVRELIDGATGE